MRKKGPNLPIKDLVYFRVTPMSVDYGAACSQGVEQRLLSASPSTEPINAHSTARTLSFPLLHCTFIATFYSARPSTHRVDTFMNAIITIGHNVCRNQAD